MTTRNAFLEGLVICHLEGRKSATMASETGPFSPPPHCQVTSISEALDYNSQHALKQTSWMGQLGGRKKQGWYINRLQNKEREICGKAALAALPDGSFQGQWQPSSWPHSGLSSLDGALWISWLLLKVSWAVPKLFIFPCAKCLEFYFLETLSSGPGLFGWHLPSKGWVMSECERESLHHSSSITIDSLWTYCLLKIFEHTRAITCM